jgi:hypothetical protein
MLTNEGKLVGIRVGDSKNDGVLLEYTSRPSSLEAQSLLSFLRNRHPSGTPTPVSVRKSSRCSDKFLGQFLVFHVPFRNFDQDFTVAHLPSLPGDVLFTAAVVTHVPHFSSESFRALLEQEQHQAAYVDNACFALDGRLAKVRRLLSGHLEPVTVPVSPILNDPLLGLDEDQRRAASAVLSDLIGRTPRRFCADVTLRRSQWLTLFFVSPLPKTFLALHGGPGSGKSFTARRLAQSAHLLGLSVAVLAPTGFLAASFADLSTYSLVDTFHGFFHVMSGPAQRRLHVADLSLYDLIIVDEMSMISEQLFGHCLAAVNSSLTGFRPLLLFTGDLGQLEPIRGSCFLASGQLSALFVHMGLTGNHRVRQSALLQTLSEVRLGTKPAGLCRNRTLARRGRPAEGLRKVVAHRGAMTVLTVTRKAARLVNKRVKAHLFSKSRDESATYATLNATKQSTIRTTFFVGEQVLVTKNLNKSSGLVNGLRGVVHALGTTTVQISARGILFDVHFVHEVFSWGPCVHLPLVSAYALTVHKVQGQSLLGPTCFWCDPWFVRAKRTMPGLVYVAVSRVSTLDDLFFLEDIPASLIETPKVLHLFRRLVR